MRSSGAECRESRRSERRTALYVINLFLLYFIHFSPDLAIIRDRGGLYVILSFVKIGRGENRTLRRVCSDFLSTLPNCIV
jgi:hypothetical protein